MGEVGILPSSTRFPNNSIQFEEAVSAIFSVSLYNQKYICIDGNVKINSVSTMVTQLVYRNFMYY